MTDHSQVPWADVDLYSYPNGILEKMFLTSGVLLQCKSQHFNDSKKFVSVMLIAFRTYNVTASVDFGSFICLL